MSQILGTSLSSLSGKTTQKGCNDSFTVPNSESCPNNSYLCGFSENGYAICGRVEPETCPTINGYDLESRVLDSSFTTGNISTDIECNYILRSEDCPPIFSDADIGIWQNRFGKNSDYNNKIIPEYCTDPQNDCPNDPDLMSPMSSCSGFVSNNRTKVCRDWASTNDMETVNTLQHGYCRDNQTRDCLCLNRSDDPTYKFLSGAGVTPDYTWYRPCRDNKRYIVSPEIEKEASKTQPANCQPFSDYLNNSDLYDANSVENRLRCKGKVIITDDAEPGSGSGNFFDRYSIFIVLIISVVLILIVVAFIYRANITRKMKIDKVTNCLTAC